MYSILDAIDDVHFKKVFKSGLDKAGPSWHKLLSRRFFVSSTEFAA